MARLEPEEERRQNGNTRIDHGLRNDTQIGLEGAARLSCFFNCHFGTSPDFTFVSIGSNSLLFLGSCSWLGDADREIPITITIPFQLCHR